MPSSFWRPTVQFSSPHPPLATLIQCGFQYSRWNCSPIPRLAVKAIGSKSTPRCWHTSRRLYLPVFVFSADPVPAFGTSLFVTHKNKAKLLSKNSRRRHRQCTGTDKCTGHSTGTPTRRKTTPDEEGESRSPAPPKPEAHRHSAKGHRQSHTASQSVSPT
jgi:hypothetical protein